MRRRLFMIWARAPLAALMFVVAQGLEAPLVAHPANLLSPFEFGPAGTSCVWAQVSRPKDSQWVRGLTCIRLLLQPHPAFGSLIRVYNPKNQGSQLVRKSMTGVRFVDGRELDVSYLVACRLGFQEQGVSRLRIELLEVRNVPEDRARQKLILALDSPSLNSAFQVAQSCLALVGYLQDKYTLIYSRRTFGRARNCSIWGPEISST